MATAAYVSKVQFDRNTTLFSTMTGINTLSIGLNKTLVDVSAMNGVADFTKRIAALKDFPVTISGFFDVADVAYGYLLSDFTSGSTVLACKVFYGAATGFHLTDMRVESIDFSASVDGAMEISISLQSNSDIVTF